MVRYGSSNSVSLLLGCAGLLVASSTFAQQAPPSPASGQPSKTKVVRRPIVDLKKQAQEPRPGQVLPGQPQPKPTEAPVPTEPADSASPPTPAASPAPTAAEPPAAAPPAAEQPTPAPVPAAPAQPVLPPTPVTTPPAPVAEQPAQPPAPPARQPEQVRPVELPNTPQPAPTRTPAAKVTKPLKPAPIPVTAETRPNPAPAAANVVDPAPPAAARTVSPHVAEPLVEPAPSSPTVKLEAQEGGSATQPAPTDANAPAAEIVAAPVGEPIHVQVTSVDGPPDVIQWRVDEGEWMCFSVSDNVEGRVSLRTGLGTAATFTLADQVTVRVSRLTRVRFEQRSPQKPGMPVELVVELSRGEVDIKPLPMTPGGPVPAVVRIITPDKNFTTRLATGVRFDAFSGTRLKLVAGEK